MSVNRLTWESSSRRCASPGSRGRDPRAGRHGSRRTARRVVFVGAAATVAVAAVVVMATAPRSTTVDDIPATDTTEASNPFELPCSGSTVVSDVHDLQLPADFSRIPQRGRGDDPTVDRECARHLSSTAPATTEVRRTVTFVDDIGMPLPSPSGATADREVRWSALGDGVLAAVVSDGTGETFGVLASGLTDVEWQRLVDGLAGFTPAEYVETGRDPGSRPGRDGSVLFDR